jgi:hypothetical protein
LRGLKNEAAAAQAELVALRDESRDVKATVARFVKHPLDTALPALIGPLGNLVLNTTGDQRGSS